MLSGARELLAIRDPLDAELFVSEVLGAWWGQRLPDGDVEEIIGEALVDHAAASGTAEALALLTVIAELGTPGQASKAASAARELAARGVRRPPWAPEVGRVRPGSCWVSRDVYGDQETVIATFQYERPPSGAGSQSGQERPEAGGQPTREADAATVGESHALIALIDDNLGGMAKDAWCTSKVDTLLERCRAGAADSPLMEFEPLDPARARAMLDAALQETDRTADPPVSKSYPTYHAFVRARLRALPEGGSVPTPPHFGPDRRAALAVEFLASPEAENLSDSAAAGRCADLVIDYGCDADLGRPLRVSPIKVELFLLNWLPRKVMLRSDDREAMPHVLAAWVRWCGRKAGLPQIATGETLDAVWEASRRFEDTYGDPARLGLDDGTVERLVPDGDLEALPRRAFAVPLLTGEFEGVDLGALDPAVPDDRRLLIAAEHPEYARTAEEPPDGGVTDDGTDPGLHLTLHEIVATQLWDDTPPDAWEAAQRLLDLGYERHEVLHMLMTAVSRTIYRDLTQGRAYDRDALRAALDGLPEWWENPRPE